MEWLEEIGFGGESKVEETKFAPKFRKKVENLEPEP